MKGEFPYGTHWCRVGVLACAVAIASPAYAQVAGTDPRPQDPPGTTYPGTGLPSAPNVRYQDLVSAGASAAASLGQPSGAEVQQPRPAVNQRLIPPRGVKGLMHDRAATTPAVTAAAQAGDFIAFTASLSHDTQQIVVIDAVNQSMSVYRILPDTGEITLVSVRNIRLDSSIDYFNSGDPSPEDIRKMHTP